MIMQLSASESGKLTRKLSAGSIIRTGDPLASLELKDPGKVKKIEPFEGDFSKEWTKWVSKMEPMVALNLVMDGYDLDFNQAVQELFSDQGLESACEDINKLLTKFVDVEELFSGKAFDQALTNAIEGQKRTKTGKSYRSGRKVHFYKITGKSGA